MNYFSSNLGTIDKIIFVALILFTLSGVVVTNISPAEAHKYWLAMNLVFALGAIATGWQRAVDKGEKTRLITSQLFHWGSTLFAVVVVYAFFIQGKSKMKLLLL